MDVREDGISWLTRDSFEKMVESKESDTFERE